MKKRLLLSTLLGLLTLLTYGQDFFVTAPYSGPSLSTCGTGNNCSLRPTEEHQYEVIIPTAGDWVFSTCGSTADTWLYVGATFCSGSVGNNNDACLTSSQVTATIAAGTYHVTVETSSGCGNYSLDVFEAIPPGVGDVCTDAIDITCNTSISGTTVGYNPESSLPACGTAWGAQGAVWYHFVGTGDFITASLCGTSYDNKISVLSGSCGTLTCVSGNDDFCGLQAQTSFISNVGVDYYIAVHGYSSGQGIYTLALSCDPPPSGEDVCFGALPIACGDILTGNTSLYTSDSAPTCGTTNGTGGGLWYAYTGTGDYVYLSSCGSSFDTKLRVYTGSCGALNCVTGTDDGGPCGLQAELGFVGELGVVYYILMHGYGGSQGAYTLSLTCNPTAGPEDICSTAPAIACGATVSGTTIGYTTAAGYVEYAGANCGTALNGSAGSVWYQFVGTGEMTTASLCGSSFNTQIKVYTGTCGGPLTCQEGNNDFCGQQSEVSFISTVGTTYYINVYGLNASQGAYTLAVTCAPIPPPTLADCKGAVTLCANMTIAGSNAGIGNYTDVDAGNRGCLSTDENNSSWYVFQAATGGTIAFDIVTTLNYNFAIWGPFANPTCPMVGAPLRCSYASSGGTTGLNSSAIDFTEGVFGNRYVAPITAAAGEIFVMMLDNVSGNTANISLNWTLGGGCTLDCTTIPLPIDLVRFTGAPVDEGIRLEWTTATEVNNNFFTVERSIDGVDFAPIGTVPGAGNSSHQMHYELIDHQPMRGTNYYRLKQTDYDGSSEYFNTISVQHSTQGVFSLYPNPGSTKVNIVCDQIRSDEACTVVITNTMGTVVERVKLDRDEHTFDVSSLSKGMYIVTIYSGSYTGVERFIKE